MTRYDRINALGIHFGQDFRFGFTCRYKDRSCKIAYPSVSPGYCPGKLKNVNLLQISKLKPKMESLEISSKFQNFEDF